MKKPFKTLSSIFLISSLMGLAITSKANSLNFSSVRFVNTTTDRLLVGSSLEIVGDGSIYALDGFNNSLQVADSITHFFPSISNNSAEITLDKAKSVYWVDGINNNLEVFDSETSQNNSNNETGYFSWNKILSLDSNGNIFQYSQVISRGNNNVYVVDGINNQIQVLNTQGSGNVYLVDGINNNFQIFNPDRRDSSLSNSNNHEFNWIKTLTIDKTGKINRANKVDFSGQTYNIDGINQTKKININNSWVNTDTAYLVDGINNGLQILPKHSTFLESLKFLNPESDYYWDWSFNGQAEPEIPWDDISPIINNIQINLPDNFASTLLLNLGQLENFNRSANLNFDDVDNLYFLEGINNQFTGFDRSRIKGIENVYSINGINSTLQILPSNSALEATSIPESSPKVGLLLLLMGGTAYYIKKHFDIKRI